MQIRKALFTDITSEITTWDKTKDEEARMNALEGFHDLYLFQSNYCYAMIF